MVRRVVSSIALRSPVRVGHFSQHAVCPGLGPTTKIHSRLSLVVGRGEAAWFPVLRRLRRGVRYIGVDTSDYAVQRFSTTRHIRRGTVGGLGAMRLPGNIDLIVCADVLQYVDARDAARGLRAIRTRLGGVAYIETFTTADGMEGDRDGWHERSAAEYRRLLRAAKLVQCGPYCYVDPGAYPGLNDFERGSV